ncbi:hypothetical protein [Aliiglaciecola sp. LCG003]|uniref:hypothetical protein n=1 Tax=Aliiglaciecola sp. LCG003 TaxID=3053655 RepID=UPI00257297F1|nr:hypothetical protein [Aliiglaciecola sp. LCG003]WJG07737.1 hypothetical protein QR722_10195 [Aliiglaciecola sp. LCG003]
MYKELHRDTTKVECRDGRIVPCNYLERSDFTFDNDLYADLHYAFVSYGAVISYARAYSFRTGINLFLDFKASYENGMPKSAHLTSITDVIPEVMGKFEQYVKSNKCPKDTHSRFFSVLRKVANENDDGFPLISEKTFKSASRNRVTEPLSKEAFNSLSSLFVSKVDKLYKKIEFIDEVEKLEPYTIEEIKKQIIKQQAKFNIKGNWYWIPNEKRVLKTLLSINHPFGISLDDFLIFHETLNDKVQTASVNLLKLNTLEDLIYATYRHAQHRRIRKIEEKLVALPTLNELLGKYFPQPEEQAVLALFLCLQTGWNKETVFAIDPNNYEHVLSGSIDSDHLLITAEKEKSQSGNLPYFNPKQFLAASDKSNKYSAFNLIRLAKKLSKPLSKLSRESFNSSDLYYSELFLVMRGVNHMTAKSSINKKEPVGRFTSISSKSIYTAAINKLLSETVILDTKGRITSVKELTPKLRPTWIRYVRDESNSPLTLVSLQQGHESIDTTDIHYDNSSIAQQKRLERLSEELKEITQRLRKKNFKGLVHKHKATKKLIGSLRMFYLPSHDRALWGCGNSFSPDFPNAEKIIKDGAKCNEISLCLFCSQVRIFEDSLPFIMDRDETLVRLLDSSDGFKSTELENELQVIRYIINEWKDEKALKQAARYKRKFDSLLPVDMGSLRVIFEDD